MERINQFLARRGVASRRAADALLREGRVLINGEKAAVGSQVDGSRDAVTVDGKPVRRKALVTTIMLNKPKGIVTTLSDPESRPTVLSLVPDLPGLVPVGRLDTDSSGLLLLTTDGDLCHALTHPKYRVEKEYVVTVDEAPTEEQLQRIQKGVMLDDGFAKPVRAMGNVRKRTITIVMREGRKREVRRICRAVHLRVVRLERVRIGTLRLGALPQGAWRELTPDEIAQLRPSQGGARTR